MVKQGILIIGASVAATFFAHQLVLALSMLVHAHNVVEAPLAGVFSGDKMGRVIQGVVALVLIPVGVGAVLSVAYYLVKKTAMPHVLTIVWVIWTILLTTLIAQAG
ncbi:MAG: hypothetical protein COB66_02040 [Coxiella sp. (in: Bacteria)]|nr:MAG: hypothetical protein COB66_02040 [Coxiella sp. (in: g-proteobacteria)]